MPRKHVTWREYKMRKLHKDLDNYIVELQEELEKLKCANVFTECLHCLQANEKDFNTKKKVEDMERKLHMHEN